jgi:hypothetical protein
MTIQMSQQAGTRVFNIRVMKDHWVITYSA